jgi:hypothetical protein
MLHVLRSRGHGRRELSAAERGGRSAEKKTIASASRRSAGVQDDAVMCVDEAFRAAVNRRASKENRVQRHMAI